ncbi:E3 ubiquitin-protein ligase PRT1 [Platanthera guangdongensis]|uniref:E3 ubiquitin-protein ligase PRT1 n=1 Tax=Platanthera guangdongensis TaxID=2320717 RepID=A0ABR2M0P9_9ASPA
MAGGEEAAEPAGSSSLARLMEEVEAQEGSYHPSFQCCVCLDLLFKPVVLACGHMSCFWCVHKAMHGLRASYCAICRQPYIHFPNICELLHILVLKMEPVAYKRREKEVLEEERRLDVFSPQFNSLPCEDICSDCNGSGDLQNVGDSFDNQGNSGSNISKQAILQKNGSKNHILMDISKDDVLCAMCRELLFQPTVLNCGHVFCESCLSRMGSEDLKCHICQSIHPGEFPKICLDLDRFLEEQFSNEYSTRRERLQQLKKLNHQCGGPSMTPSGAELKAGGICGWRGGCWMETTYNDNDALRVAECASGTTSDCVMGDRGSCCAAD